MNITIDLSHLPVWQSVGLEWIPTARGRLVTDCSRNSE